MSILILWPDRWTLAPMWTDEGRWESELVPDMVWEENPRREPDYAERARRIFRDNLNQQGEPEKAQEVAKWPLMRLERTILRTPEVMRYLGTREAAHMVRYLCHLLPSIVPDPWFQERVWAFFDCRTPSSPDEPIRKVMNWWGSQNSGKTQTAAAMCIGFAILHPEATRQSVSSPYKEAGDMQLWNAVCAYFYEACDHWGLAMLAAINVFPNMGATKKFIRFGNVAGAGSIKLVAMDEVGKIQGGKAKDREQKAGYIIYWLDEVGAGYPNLSFIEVLPNLRSNRNFMAVTMCNPKNPEGELDGELGRPNGGWQRLDIDRSVVWDSAHGSRTYRFDGHRSPNFGSGGGRLGKWPWLFNEERKRELADAYPPGSDKYNEQCRAYMSGTSGAKYVLTRADVEGSGHDRDFIWTELTKQRVAYLDPALSSGGDEAVFTVLEIGERKEIDGTRIPTVYAAMQEAIPIVTGMQADGEWVKMMERVRGKEGGLHVGEIVSPERQLAVACGVRCMDRDIPFTHFGYDDSMRGKVMEAFQWAMGAAPIIVSYVGEPEDVPMYPPKWKDGRERVTWRDECRKFVSQVWFFGAAVIRSGQFRSHPSALTALDQAVRRKWDEGTGGKKRDIEGKDEYKARPPKESPDRADSLFGAIHVAQKRGLLTLRVDMAEPNSQHGAGPSWIIRRLTNRRLGTGLHLTGSRS